MCGPQSLSFLNMLTGNMMPPCLYLLVAAASVPEGAIQFPFYGVLATYALLATHVQCAGALFLFCVLLLCVILMWPCIKYRSKNLLPQISSTRAVPYGGRG